MATSAVSKNEMRDSWVPIFVIAMGQMLMPFNVAAIPVSMNGKRREFPNEQTTSEKKGP